MGDQRSSVKAPAAVAAPAAAAAVAVPRPASAWREAAASEHERDVPGPVFDYAGVRIFPPEKQAGEHLRRLVQRKPIVGDIADPAEAEADRAAAEVLGLAAAPSQAASGGASGAAAAATPAGSTPVRAAAAPPAPAAASAFAGESPTEQELEDGGEPLPEHLRTFFEGRFGHDFGSVRIHTGDGAEAATASVGARAFTYGSHIWLGRGEPVGPSFVMAHELAHVVQQTEPSVARTVRRAFDNKIPYWWPEDNASGKGDAYHDEVVEALGKAGSMFSEVPIPGGSGRFTGHGVAGRADLYDAKRTIGVQFVGPGQPAFLKEHRAERILFAGAPYGRHDTESAPQGRAGRVERMAEAPDTIRLGEVKPPPLSSSALGSYASGVVSPGAKQALSQYISGIKETAAEVNDLPADQRGGLTWNPTVEYLSGITIPGKYATSGKGEKKSVVLVTGGIGGGRVPYDNPPVKATGRLRVVEGKDQGVWHYAWIPTKDPDFKIGKRAEKLPADVQSLIMNPLFLPPPIKAGPKKKRRKPAATARAAPMTARRLERDVVKLLRRKPRTPPEKDSFDRAKWDTDYTTLIQEQGSLAETQEGKKAAAQHAVNDAREALREQGFDVDPLSSTEKKFEKGQERVEFWLSPKAKVFAWLREHFGRSFVYIAQIFQKFRDRVSTFFDPKTGAAPRISTGDGLIRKILQVAWKLIKIAGKKMIHDVMDALWDSMAAGIAKKLKSLIPEEVDENLDAAHDYAAKLGGELQQAADTILTSLDLGNAMSVIEKVQDVYDAIRDIGTLVSSIRWLIRVIQCATPPGWGCLKLLLSPLTNYILGEIAETCWFQEEITPYIERMDFVRSFSKNVAGEIVVAVQGALPASLADFLVVPDVGWRVADSPEARCKKDKGSKDLRIPTEADKKFAELAEEIGEERLEEVSKLLAKMGVDPNAPITEEQVAALRKFLVDNDIAVEQLKNYVEHFPAIPDGMNDFGEFLDGVKKLPEKMRLQPGDMIEDVGDGTGEGPGAGGPDAGTGGGGGVGPPVEEGEETEGGGYIAQYDAQKHVVETKPRQRAHKRYMVVVDPSWDHQAGRESPYRVTLGLEEKGQVTALLLNAEAWCVKEKDLTKKKQEFVKYYRLHVTYEVPNRNFVFLPNVDIPGKIFTKTVPKNRKKPRKSRS